MNWAYMMMIIPVPETASCHLIWYLRFYFIISEMAPNLKKYVKLLVSVSSSLGCFRHYLSSVILYFTFESSPLKPLRQMNPKLGMHHQWKVRFIPPEKHACREQFLLLIGWNFKNLLHWNKEAQWFLLYRRFCTAFSYFVPMAQLICPP